MAKPKVLLVDADLKSRQMLEISLKKGGFTVTSCEEGEKALQLVETLVPDLIMSDIDLAGSMDGFLFCEVVKETPEFAKIPFIFLSKRKAVGDKIRGLELGVDDYLTKPIYLKELIARVRMLLERTRQENFDISGTEPQFQGDLSQMSVVDILQTMEMGGKTGVVHLDRDGRGAKLYCRQGRVVHAVADNLVGERAVYRVLLWNEGTFRLDFRKSLQTQETIQVGTQGLIMEGMRRLDELERLKEQLPPLNTLLAIDSQTILEEHPDRFPAKIENILAEFDGSSTLEDVVEALPYDDLESLEIISKLYFQGFLIEVDPDEATESPEPAPSDRSGSNTRLPGAGSTLDTQMLQLEEASKSIEEIKARARLAQTEAAPPASGGDAPEAPGVAGSEAAATPPARTSTAGDLGDDTGFELAPPEWESPEWQDSEDEALPDNQESAASTEAEAPPAGTPEVADSPGDPDPDTRAAALFDSDEVGDGDSGVAAPLPPVPPMPAPAGDAQPLARVIPVRQSVDGSAARELAPPAPEARPTPSAEAPPAAADRRGTGRFFLVLGLLALLGGGGWFAWNQFLATGADPVARLELAEAAAEREAWRDAIGHAEAAVAAAPDLGRAWLVLGQAQAELGRSAEAERAYERAIEVAPSLHAARVALVALRFDRGDSVAPLRRDLSQLLGRLDPVRDRVVALDAAFLAVRLALSETDRVEAQRWIDYARRIAPDDRRIGVVEARLPAAPAAQAAAPTTPRPAAVRPPPAPAPRPEPARPAPAAPTPSQEAVEALLRDGEALYRRGQLREAEQVLQRAVRQAPEHDALLVAYGQVLVELGRDAQATEIFLRAGKVNPRNPEVYVNLGSIYMLQGDQSRARRAYRAYLDLVPAGSREAEEIRKVLENL